MWSWTMGSLRSGLIYCFVAYWGLLLLVSRAPVERWLMAAGLTAVLLFLPSLRTSRISAASGLRPMRLTWPIVGVFAVANTLMTLSLLDAPGWAVLGALAGYLLSVGWFLHRVAVALRTDHSVLRPSGGDLDFGVFTALTPMQAPPGVDVNHDRPAATSLYEPVARRDPIEGLRSHEAADPGHRRPTRGEH